jgi:hypothetical protein
MKGAVAKCPKLLQNQADQKRSDESRDRRSDVINPIKMMQNKKQKQVDHSGKTADNQISCNQMLG